jgi:hypothetical protein
MQILKLAMQLKVNPGAEASLPEPAMGNMKPTTEGYREKWLEKRAKQIEELKDEPYCVRVEKVAWAIGSDPVMEGDFQKFVDYLNSLKVLIDRVVSPRPSRDIKVMVCECWHREIDVPTAFCYRPLDIMRLFGAGKDDMLGACRTPSETVGLLSKALNMMGAQVFNLTE